MPDRFDRAILGGDFGRRGSGTRAACAMAAVERELIRPQDGLALLFTPPFDQTPLDPGYIKGYPPGIRENGGQYTHAAAWSVMAFAALGQGDKAVRLFSLLNPINHARTRAGVQRYKVEPYVIAADVYSNAAPRRTRRLDVVHRLGRMDAARGHREHPRTTAAGRGAASRPVHPEGLAELRDDSSIPLRAIRDPGRQLRRRRPGHCLRRARRQSDRGTAAARAAGGRRHHTSFTCAAGVNGARDAYGWAGLLSSIAEASMNRTRAIGGCDNGASVCRTIG